MQFNGNSACLKKASPMTDDLGLSDAYISLWFRFNYDIFNQTGTKAVFLRCANPTNTANFGIDISLYKATEQKIAQIKAALQSTVYTTTQNDIQSLVDLRGWNQVSVYVDSSRFLHLSVNNKTDSQVSLARLNALFALTIANECKIGGGDIYGLGLRHIIISAGMKQSIQNYNSKYAHSIPAPLDPYLLAHYRLEAFDETRITFRVFEGESTFETRYEPDPVCHCLGNEDFETSNYPLLGHSSNYYFESIYNLPFPNSSASSDFKVQLTFVVNVDSYATTEGTNQDIISHDGFWNFGFFNPQKYYLKIAGIADPIILQDTKLVIKSKKLVFLHSWMRYTITIENLKATLTLDDLSSPNPVILTSNFQSQLKIDTMFNTTKGVLTYGSFNLAPSSVGGLFSRVAYAYNDVLLFDFQLSESHFVHTSQIDPINNKNFMQRYHKGYFVSGQIMLKTASLGVQFLQANGPCNQSDPAFQFDGLVCKDQNRYMGLNQRKGSNTHVESYLRATSSKYTFEAWFKFDGFSQTDQKAASLLSVYGLADAIQMQISIVKGDVADSVSTDIYSIKCDPNPKEPRLAGMFDPVKISNLVKPGQWMHYSCLSNNDDQKIWAYLYDLKTQNSYNSIQSGSYISQVPQQLPARTIFGNSLDLSQPYKGILKEIRLWNTIRSEHDLEQFRYQSIPIGSDLRKVMLAYIMLNQGTGNQYSEIEQLGQMTSTCIYEATAPIQTASLQQISPITWISDTSSSPTLRICPPSTVYNPTTSCCLESSFYAKVVKTWTVEDQDSKTYVSLKLNIIENNTDQISQGHYSHSWQVANVSNYGSSNDSDAHLAKIQSYIDKQPNDEERELLIPQDMLIFNATYRFNVTIKSLIREYNNLYMASVEVRPQCPQIRFVQKINNYTPLKVSSKMAPNLLKIDLEIKDGCIDPQISIMGIEWSVSSPENTYSISKDQKSLLFSKYPDDTKTVYVSVKVSYSQLNDALGTIEKVSDSLTIQFLDVPFSLNVNDQSQVLDADIQDIVIDFSNSEIYINYPLELSDRKIEYKLDCPPFLFKSDSQLHQLCNPDPLTGALRIPTSQIPYVNYQDYKFTYYLKSDVLGYVDQKDVTFQFFVKRYEYCPKLTLAPYTSFAKSDQNYLIRPYAFLQCFDSNFEGSAINTYSIKSLTWQVEGYTNPRDFLEITGIVALVRRSYIGDDVLQPLFSKNISIKGQLSDGSKIDSTTTFTILRSNIVINITESHSSGMVPFNETMVLDSTPSYDPDFPSQKISLSWTFKDGQLKQDQTPIITLTPFDRLDMGLMTGDPQKFILDSYNIFRNDNQISQIFWMQFQEHYQNNNFIFSNSCSISLQNSQDTYYFNLLNATDVWLSAVLNDKPSCLLANGFIKVDSRFYLRLPDQLQKKGQSVYLQTQQHQIKQDDIKVLAPGASMSLDFVYLASFTKSGSLQIFYDYLVKTVTIKRVFSPLQIKFKDLEATDYQQVGQESTFTIDASDSYDLESKSSAGINYIWICDTLLCDQIGPKLRVTKEMRVDRSQNNIGTTIKIGLHINKGTQESEVRYVNLRIVAQDYNKCINMKIQNSVEGKLYISKQQEFPINLKIDPEYVCDSVVINSVIWSTQDVAKFWDDNGSSFFITLKSNSSLPQDMDKVKMTVNVQYTVRTSTESLPLNLTYSFLLNFENAKLLVKVMTSTNIYNISGVAPLIINATDSFDPDFPQNSVTCKWSCPQKVSNSSLCGSTDCYLQLEPEAFNYSEKVQISEIAEFSLTIYSQNGFKSDYRSIFITIVSSDVMTQLPSCSIQNAQGKELFDLDKNLLFYPSCTPSTPDAVYNSDFYFEWSLSPSIDRLVLNTYRLDVPKYHLYTALSDPKAGHLLIKLKVYSSEFSYTVQRSYTLPKLYDSMPPNQGAPPTVIVEPAVPTNMVTKIKLEISSYSLQNNQYYRLRAQKTLQEQEVIIEKFKSSPVMIYLPRYTIDLYLEIIEDKVVGSNEYNVYSMKIPGLTLQEPGVMTANQFQTQFLPRIQALPDPLFDYTDLAKIIKQLNELRSLKKIVSGVQKERMARYNSLMFSKVGELYNNTLLNPKSIVFDKVDRLKEVKSGFFEILSQNFIEGCENDEYKAEREQYLEMIMRDLSDDKSIQAIIEKETDLDIKNTYIVALNKIAKSSCLNKTSTMMFASMSDRIFFQSILEGEMTQYESPLNQANTSTIYKLSALDLSGNTLIKYGAQNNATSASLRSIFLPQSSSFISYNATPNSNLFQANQNNNQASYNGSNSQISINVLDKSVNRLVINDKTASMFQILIQFSIFNEIIVDMSMSKQNQTYQYRLVCMANQEGSNAYIPIKTGLIDSRKGTIQCLSNHLSAFNVQYLQQVVTQPLKVDVKSNNKDILINQEDSIFEEVPLLKYLLPSLFAVFILLFAVCGLIMNQMEYNRPRRFYNKLSLSENLDKYTISRLLCCLILQYNPFFNFVFKTNFYLSRPLRLLLLTNYFLLISSACLLYYNWLAEGIRIADIFWFGFLLHAFILILRPKLQDSLFSLFYPPTLTNWKAREKYRIRSPNVRRRRHTEERSSPAADDMILGLDDDTKKKKRKGSVANRPGSSGRRMRTQYDEEELDKMYNNNNLMHDSTRIQNSVDRLVGTQNGPQGKNNADELVDDHHDAAPERTRGDEIIQFRGQRLQRHESSNQNRFSQTQQMSPIKQQQDQDPIVKRLFNKLVNIDNKQPPASSIEMSDLSSQIKLSHQHPESRDAVRGSLDSNQRSDLQQSRDYAGFQFDHQQQQQQTPDNQQQVVIELDENNRDSSILDINTSKMGLQAKSQDDYYDDEDIEKEGGDKEEDQSENFSPDPLHPKSRIPKINNDSPSLTGKGPNKKQRASTTTAQVIQLDDGEEIMPPENPGNEENNPHGEYQEESTPSLESLYKNYRELKEQSINRLKKFCGIILLLIIWIGLLFLHFGLLKDIKETQFENWISCTLFTFMVMIFCVDTLLYAIVAWALKKTEGKVDRRRFCSIINLFVYLPLGRWKFMELEIELAKMKDFDKEYGILSYA